MNPLLLLVQGEGAKVFRLNSGNTDDGRPIVMRAVPVEVAPGGAGRQCVFHRLYLVLTHSMPAPVPVRVIPIVDGVRRDTEARSITLSAAPAGGSVTKYYRVELASSVVTYSGATVAGRTGLRGTWFTYLLDTPAGLGPGMLEVEAGELEFELARDNTRAA